ncbi:hypothetical protein J6590_052566 [Homalodisca vitripennis]|nr:hypothetical protein J6590_052566 [Homalodisca vitripennis]
MERLPHHVIVYLTSFRRQQETLSSRVLLKQKRRLILPCEDRAKKPSLTLNLETNGSEFPNHHQWPGRRAACKNRIAQRSPIQAAATLDVA